MKPKIPSQLQAVIDNSSPQTRKRVRQDIRVLVSAGADGIESVVALLQNRRAPISTREIAAWVLGKLGDRRSVSPLLQILKSENSQLTWEAAKALAQIGNRRSVQPLVAILTGQTSTQRRAAAAYALGFLGDRHARKPLVDVLKNRRVSAMVRSHAAEALAYLKDPESFRVLMGALKDPSPEVRFWAAFALGELRDSRAINELERLAATDRTRIPGWSTMSQEAEAAIMTIRGR